MISGFVFFFFQAEDGIRDHCVTGVQDVCSSDLPRLCVTIGQFTRLLPTLVVVAVSQAPSPESNPNSPLPVIAMIVQYTINKLMGQIPLRACAARSVRYWILNLIHPFTTAFASVGFCFGLVRSSQPLTQGQGVI